MIIVSLAIILQLFNPNPLHLDSKGEASVAVYLQPHILYTLILYRPAAGAGLHSCLGTSVGEVEWQVDNIADVQIATMFRSATRTQFKTKAGKPAANFVLCSYRAGTTIPLPTLRR